MSKKTSQKDILLLCGGGGLEHDISLSSAHSFMEILQQLKWAKVHYGEIGKDRICRDGEGKIFHWTQGETKQRFDFAIPCIHGVPGENGEIQCLFEWQAIPYLGTGPEGSLLCFNKISTKLWLEALGIPTAPFLALNSSGKQAFEQAQTFFHEQGEDIFVKLLNKAPVLAFTMSLTKKNSALVLKKLFNTLLIFF